MVTKDATFVWKVTKSGVSWHRRAIGRAALASKVKRLRQALDPTSNRLRGAKVLGQGQAKSRKFDHALAQEIYSDLFGDAAASATGASNLLIIPSGPLTSLPFHTLVVPDALASERTSGKTNWLLRRYSITILPTVKSLIGLRRRTSSSVAANQYIGFADPVFSKEPQRETSTPPAQLRSVAGLYRNGRVNALALASLTPLPESADEVRTISKLLGRNSFVRIGDQATETNVKKLSLKDYRIVHFATHGLVSGELRGLAEPALALTAPKVPSEVDDGLLTASEVAELKLNAEWVILSACNTAAGRENNAEALSGLARAFFYAGSQTLLVSHWPVFSNAAVQITTKAIAALKRNSNIGRAAALRLAMLELADSNNVAKAEPSYWAPFVVVGEGGGVN